MKDFWMNLSTNVKEIILVTIMILSFMGIYLILKTLKIMYKRHMSKNKLNKNRI